MASDHAPRMSMQEYDRYLNRAAEAKHVADVRRLRAELIAEWRGDSRAEDLVEALYLHQQRLAAKDNVLVLEAGRMMSRSIRARARRWTD